MLADSTAGRCGSPAPTTITGSPDWLISWQAAQSAETSSGPRSCISSMKIADPLADVGGQPAEVGEQLDEVDLDVAGVGAAAHGGGVDAGAPLLAQLRARAPPRAGRRSRITPSTWSTSSLCGWPSSRTAWCSALDSGRRSRWSGRASSLPVPQLLADGRPSAAR